VNPATPEEGRFSRGGCAVQRCWPDSGLRLRVVCRGGLLGIEGLAVRVRFDPDRRTQRTVLAAVHRRGRWLLFEVLNPFESGVRLSHASDSGVALHTVSLLPHGHPVCSIGHGARRPCAFQ
jgi:hypothetical protein